MRRGNVSWAGVVLLLAGCDIVDPPPMDPALNYELTVTGGADQIGLPGDLLEHPISVRLYDKVRFQPVSNLPITFRADPETGLQFESLQTTTDSAGKAQVKVRLGQRLGRHKIRIDFAGYKEKPAEVEVEAATIPVITSVTPRDAQSEGEITIRGQNFGAQPNWNDVRVGTLRAAITRASSTEIKAQLPRCLSNGAAQVVVRRGQISSAPMSVTVSGATLTARTLQTGATLLESENQSCLRVAAQSIGTRYLIMPINVSTEGTSVTMFDVSGSSGTLGTSGQKILLPEGGISSDAALTFETRLRQAEAAFTPLVQPRPAGSEQVLRRIAVPQVGDIRRFNVATQWANPETVTGEVKVVGRRLVIYVDKKATGVTPELLQYTLNLFDNFVYDTDVAVFGETSDIDSNGRVAMLITPAVNRLTPSGSNGFISGYFYGCDLVTALQCPDTNSGEILYTLAPDPSGEFGMKHSLQTVTQLLPTILAHEFMHAIHYNQRMLSGISSTPETLWLMEALAHSAEDTVASVIYNRGDTATANDLHWQNYRRASYFLGAPDKTSLVPTSGSGTLEERGAAWLLLKYLRGLDPAILGKLTRARDTGSRNIVTVSGTPWSELLRNWGTALYASAAPELNGVTVLPEHTFRGFDVRRAVSSVVSDGRYPLVPRPTNSDFSLPLALPASSVGYLLVDVPAGHEFYLTLDGGGVGFSPAASAGLALMRIR